MPLLAACAEKQVSITSTTTSATTSTTIEEKPHVLVAVGDIACSQAQKKSASSDECQEARVADLIRSINPEQIILLGDIQYNSGDEFVETFQPLWSDLIEKSYPVLGNHEYESPNAEGFFDFFGYIPEQGYYSFDAGEARVFALNTNCYDIDCDEEAFWFQTTVAAFNGDCAIAVGHHPRYSSGAHGDTPEIEELYSVMIENKVDLYISGHDHHYEYIDAPVPQIVAGTGGRSLRGSANGIAEYGVVKIVIYDDYITTEFVSVDGQVLDTNQIICNNVLPEVD